MSTPISLLQMPKVPMEHILEYLDFPSILVLRKVCHDLRNFINDTKPSSHLTAVCVGVKLESISFSLNQFLSTSYSSICIDYVKNGEGCLIKCKKEGEVKETIVENEDFATVFRNDFVIVLRHQKTVLNEFRVRFDSLDLTFKENVLKNVNQSMESMKQPLQVKLLFMDINDHNEVLSILPYIDPKPLECIHIYDALRSSRSSIKDNERKLNFNKIGQLDQWKKAKKLKIEGFRIPDLSQNLIHFSRIVLYFQDFSIEELILLKDMFLCSSTLNKMDIYYTKICFISARLIEAFGQDLLEINKIKNWFFRIPGTNQFLNIYFPCYRIVFSRIEESDVPQNAVILN